MGGDVRRFSMIQAESLWRAKPQLFEGRTANICILSYQQLFDGASLLALRPTAPCP